MVSLRVCTITFDRYPYEVRALRTAEAAASAGYEVDVICLREPMKENFEIHNGVRIYRLPMKRLVSPSLVMKILYWCWFLVLSGIAVTRLHLKQRYDVIHIHNMPDFLVFSALIPKLLGAKIILDIQDVSPELMAAKAKKGRQREIVVRLATWQEHISCAFAHHIVTTGHLFEAMLLKRGIPQAKITKILNSADPNLFPAERRCTSPADTLGNTQPFIVIYHGTLAARNGLDTAMQAIDIVVKDIPDVRLDIQGNGDYLPKLKQMATDLNLGEHVRFTPSVTADKLVDFVVHGDVGIIPYKYDGFMELVLPTKAYEFAWMQRPMIASDTSAIRSMFRPESIILCEPSNAQAFAEAIIELYKNKEKRAQMVTSASEDYLAFRWELMAECYQQLLLSLCPKKAQKLQKQLAQQQAVVESKL